MQFFGSTFLNILRNRTAIIGLFLTGSVVFIIIVGPYLSPYSAKDSDFMNILAAPSWAHPFGTDSFGRDVLTRVLIGARISVSLSALAIILATATGTACGILSGYYQGVVDSILMRTADLLFAFPAFVLALLLMVSMGYGKINIVFAIALVYFPIFARIARNMTLLIKEEPFVIASKVMGFHPARIMLRDILPNISAPLVVQASVGVAFAIILEAGLSFIGLGIQPPTPSLGMIMADGREYFERAPWVLTLTGLSISVILLGLNLLGDGLRDITDPKLRERS